MEASTAIDVTQKPWGKGQSPPPPPEGAEGILWI